MGDIFWNGATSGTDNFWDFGSNWSGGAAPGKGDYVYITSPGTYSVTILASDPAYTIRYLQTGMDGQEVILIDAGSLTVKESYAVFGGGFDVTSSGSATIGNLALADKAAVSVEGTIKLASIDSFRGAAIAIDGGSLTIGSADDSSAYTISAGGALDITKVASRTDTITFSAGGGTFSYGGKSHTLETRITGFHGGDVIDLTALAFKGGYSYAYSGHTLTIVNDRNPSLSFTIDSINDPAKGFLITKDGHGGTEISVACFAAGTRVLTQAGDVAVEDLKTGDLVAIGPEANRAFRPVQWIGSRRIDLTRHPRAALVAPIRIARDAIAPGMPARDLRLSPDHALYLDGVLVPVHMLVNGMTILQERQSPSVRYFHIELAQHGVLLAEGLPAESYLDTGNRAQFGASGTVTALHPAFGGTATQAEIYARLGCAPLATDSAFVKPIWDRLRVRALDLGYVPIPREGRAASSPMLIAGHRRLKPIARSSRRLVFAIPAGATELRLASDATCPAESEPYLDDRRLLGLCVRCVALSHQDGRDTIVPLDHPGLSAGWHAIERGSVEWRWTDGEATLRHPMLARASLLTIELASDAREERFLGAA